MNIIMEGKNDSEEKLKTQLVRQKKLRQTLIVLYAISLAPFQFPDDRQSIDYVDWTQQVKRYQHYLLVSSKDM